MDYNTSTPALRPSAGLVVVVGLHVLLVYALVSGLARQVVAVVQQPLDVKLLQEIKPPPPPPPEVKPPPKAAAPRAPTPPPPAYVPPPEVPVPTTVAPPITTVAAPPPPAPAPETAAPPAPPAPARVAAVIQASDCAKPEYPPLSLRREEAGTVRLRFLVSAEGKVIDSRIETSSGFPRLDEAARQALSQCKFKPGTVDGRPEQGWAGLNYTWRLE